MHYCCPLFPIHFRLHWEALLESKEKLQKALFSVQKQGFDPAALNRCFGVLCPLIFIYPPHLIDPFLPTNFVYYTHYLLLSLFSSSLYFLFFVVLHKKAKFLKEGQRQRKKGRENQMVGKKSAWTKSRHRAKTGEHSPRTAKMNDAGNYRHNLSRLLLPCFISFLLLRASVLQHIKMMCVSPSEEKVVTVTFMLNYITNNTHSHKHKNPQSFTQCLIWTTFKLA